MAHHARAGRPPAVTVVRPASIVGPGAAGLLPGLFEAVRVLALRDARCLWQFCHVDDLVTALAAAAYGDRDGRGDGRLRRLPGARARSSGSPGCARWCVPHALARVTAERLHRVGAIGSPASDLEYLMHPWVVGSQRLRATGWKPRWSNECALTDHLERLGDRAGRSLLVVDRKDATRARRPAPPSRSSARSRWPGRPGRGGGHDGPQGRRTHRSATSRCPSRRCWAPSTLPGVGGTVLFIGTVRDHDGGRDVAGLAYSAHPTALQTMTEVIAEVAAEFPGAAPRGKPPGRGPGGRGRRRRRGRGRGAPRRGVPGRQRADRPDQGRGADLEASAVRRTATDEWVGSLS